MKFLLATLSLLALVLPSPAIEPVETFAIWPGTPPGQSPTGTVERIVENRPRPFYQITDVSKPMLSVFLPPKEQRTGAAILICPGGGLQRLAYEHEGLEVAEWLASHNIAAFVLKYRVPAPVTTGLQDAQRAMGIIRARATQWDVDAANLGVIGFSAGGEIAAWLATHYDKRQYETLEAADSLPCRPDFAALIYPGGLLAGPSNKLKEEIADRINQDTPPMFMVHASDDACQNSLALMLALKQVRVPAELHLYRDGGHGFGMRKSGSPYGTWIDRLEDWMKSLGYLDKAFVKNYARDFSEAVKGDGKLEHFPQAATLENAYAAQRRFVRLVLKNDKISGFKGGVITDTAQKNLGVNHPLTGVLFTSGRADATNQSTVNVTVPADTIVETEVGFIIGTDISSEVLNEKQARDAVQNVALVIELPVSFTRRMGNMTATDIVAGNMGASKFIVGPLQNPADFDLNSLKLSLKRNGQALNETDVGAVKRGHWENLRQLLNQVTSQGYTIRAGSIIISGALRTVHPGTSGKYQADFGGLGSINFVLQQR